MKTTVIHHSADFDGLFCREIARKFLPEAQLIGWDWGWPALEFPPVGQVYVMDLSPDCFGRPLTDEEESRLIWIDHHKSAIEKYDGPDDPEANLKRANRIKGYRIDGVAACRLAWQWFYLPQLSDGGHVAAIEKEDFIRRNVIEPYAVRLAGEYDVWDKRNPDADVFQFGLRSVELSDKNWNDLLSLNRKPSIDEIEALLGSGHQIPLEPDGKTIPLLMVTLLKNGEAPYRIAKEANKFTVTQYGFIVEFEGLKFLAVNTPQKSSLVFEERDIPETGHDALLKFNWTGKLWDVSMYHAKHRTDLDLSEIAIKHGGGGHRGACGFRALVLPWMVQGTHWNEPVQESLVFPEKLTPELDEVLGLLSMATAPLARVYREAGIAPELPRKIEREQAFILHKVILLALKHGTGWHEEFKKEINPICERLRLRDENGTTAAKA